MLTPVTNDTPTPVTIVRPNKGIITNLIAIPLGVGFVMLRALLIWWIAPHVWHAYPLGYWQTLGALYLINWATPGQTSFLTWTDTMSAIKSRAKSRAAWADLFASINR